MSQTRVLLLSAVCVALAATTMFESVATAETQGDAPAATPPVTFTQDIAPLIIEKCAGCHRPDGPAPFSLLTYAAVRQRATQIAAVTQSRFMPPWKSEPGYGDFVGQQPLTDAEITVIRRWVDAGAPEGPARNLPVPQRTGVWQLGTPDLIVTMPQRYKLPADGTDVFRTFVIPLPVGAVRYVRGLEFRPDNPQIVHHANIRIDRTPMSRELDQQDPAPGHDGMARSAEFPDGHFLAWTPGQVTPLLPKGLAWRLDPGTDLVFQLHLRPSGKPEDVQVSIGVFFGSDAPERTPLILRLGRQDIDIPAGATNHPITDAYVLPVDVEVQAVQPHAHYRGREIRGFATLPDGTTRWLIYIRDWDFRWQHVYRYLTPPLLPKGTTLTMQYTYDNSTGNARNPVRPPARARYGWQSADEMGELYVQLLTRDERDRTVLEQAFQPKSIAEDIAGYESILQRSPAGARLLHNDVALLYLQLGRHADAIGHFETAIRLRPDLADGYFSLGTALRLAGRFEDAIRQYLEAVRIQPDHAVAHNHLGGVFLELGRADEALDHYREAVRAAPHLAAAHTNLGVLLRRRGDLDEAVSHFQESLRIDPEDAPALMSLAWIFATATDAARRDADQAVRLAEHAVVRTRRREAEALDVLAAAYAANGLFDRAVETLQDAIQLGPGGLLAADMRDRLELYRRRQPYRESAGASTTPAP